MSVKSNSKQKKMNVRVDFTPMVDMNMLLITFFMLCTSLSKPKTMEISMPSNDKNITDAQKNKVKESQAITLLLCNNNQLFYYDGQLKLDDPKSLVKSSFDSKDKNGLRTMLLGRNSDAVQQAADLKKQLDMNKITKEDYQKQLDEVKSGEGTPTVIIKATDDSSYKNLIDALDEMQICSIGKYVIAPITPEDKELLTKFGHVTIKDAAPQNK